MATAMAPQAAQDQIRAALDAIDAAHRVLRQTSSALTNTAFRLDVAERLETQERVNRALMYRVFDELAEPSTERGAADAIRGALWERLNIPPREITRRFRQAARIRPRRALTGPTLAPELPELAAAVADGAIGDDHIRVICRALDTLPTRLSPAAITEAEHSLVAHARHLDSDLLTRIGQRIHDHLNPDGDFTDDDRARRRYLQLGRQGPDGMSRLRGLLDPETRAYLEAITAAVRPGRHQPDTPTPAATALLGGDTRSAGQRCHDALKLALSTAIASGNMGTHRGHPVTVVITTTLAELETAATSAADPHATMPTPARTGGGSWLPMRDLIRMATTAIHYLAVFDDHLKRPLYLGRQKRIATADQRLICYARDRGCTHPNCCEPGYHCEVHHTPDWTNGGHTNADKLHFACGPHHGAITRGTQHTIVTQNGRLGWTNGTTPPQTNHAHHPDELLHGDTDPPTDKE
ncbi:HNH endonuclease signature motif containing protein [Mycolicibacillus trivialis]|uniref:HNH endonuclease signature motif containing protein n=1 Tax=Mycolicibacillus trivialis TaxID=1798 RepID=UPI0021F34608|nr:HNH endonuclease signature motif containing protein [Mycolicibacillus trivialis]